MRAMHDPDTQLMQLIRQMYVLDECYKQGVVSGFDLWAHRLYSSAYTLLLNMHLDHKSAQLNAVCKTYS